MGVAHLVFAKATGTGTQTVTGVGFGGVAAVFWSTKQTAPGIATDFRWTTGLVDGTSQVCSEANFPDADASPIGSQSESWTTVLEFKSIGGTSPVASAQFTGFTSDGFTLDWTVNDGSADLIHVLVFRCSDAALVTVPTTGTAGGDTQDVSVGFQPDLIIWMPGSDSAPYSWSQNVIGPQAFGLSQPSAAANTMGRLLMIDTNAPATEPNLTQCIRVPLYSSIFVGFVTEALAVTALTADGFTLTNGSSFGVTNHTHYALCLRGITCAVGTIAPGATGDTTVTLGFQPHAILMSAADPAFSPASLSMGAWDEVNGQSVASIAADVIAGSTACVRRETSGAILRTLTPLAAGASTDYNVGEVSSADATGFVFHTTTFGAGSFGYMAFGDAVALPSSRNLLTGNAHTVQGSDNLAAGDTNAVDGNISEVHGKDGAVNGDRSVLFSLDGDPHEVTADGVFEVDANDFVINGRSMLDAVTGPGASTDRGVATWNGTDGHVLRDTPGPTIPSDSRIANVTDPINPQDVATKAYVDAGSGSAWIPLVDGGDPPNLITDGNGNLILVAH